MVMGPDYHLSSATITAAPIGLGPTALLAAGAMGFVALRRRLKK